MPKKLVLRPVGAFGLAPADEYTIYRQFFGFTFEQMKQLRRLRRLGRIYMTEGARAPCEYHVIVRKDYQVPRQYAMGVEIRLIMIHRMDGKEEPYYWRDLQDIKDLVIGCGNEALELYPSSKRRVHRFPFRALWGIVSKDEAPIGWPDTRGKK